MANPYTHYNNPDRKAFFFPTWRGCCDFYEYYCRKYHSGLEDEMRKEFGGNLREIIWLMPGQSSTLPDMFGRYFIHLDKNGEIIGVD